MNSKKRKNLRKIPDEILTKIQTFEIDTVVAAVVLTIPASEIQSGQYAHMGLISSDNQPTYEAKFLPLESRGRYSKWNKVGREIIRKDLPKKPKSYMWLAPHFGDWSRGSHIVSRTRDVYPRDFKGPKFALIEVELLESVPHKNSFNFKFSVLLHLERNSSGFHDDLLFALNMLQENVGAINVFSSSSTAEDYLKSVYHVSWELLPVGKKEEDLFRISEKLNVRTPQAAGVLASRYDLLHKLKPNRFIYGTSGFQRYFGALFGEKLVVLECLDYGNAIYVMSDNWEELSKLSRVELLNSRNGEFQRIIHRKGWEEVLTKIISDRR